MLKTTTLGALATLGAIGAGGLIAGSQMRMDCVIDDGSIIPRSPRPAAAGVRCE
jgi:hypothetical protein